MGTIGQRRLRGAVCPRCHHPDYKMMLPVKGVTIKTVFRCRSCGHRWSCGYAGGVYAELADEADQYKEQGDGA